MVTYKRPLANDLEPVTEWAATLEHALAADWRINLQLRKGIGVTSDWDARVLVALRF
jgi:hypothetical protein